MNLSPHPTSGLVCSPFLCGGSVFVDLLFFVSLVVCGGSVFRSCFVIQYLVSLQFSNHIDGEERAGCFSLTVFLILCDSQCFVARSHGAVVGWSAVFNCGTY